MSLGRYTPDPPQTPELTGHDEDTVARNMREISQYQAQWDALDGKPDEEFTDEDSVQMDVLERLIIEAEQENRLILDSYGIAA